MFQNIRNIPPTPPNLEEVATIPRERERFCDNIVDFPGIEMYSMLLVLSGV